MSELSPPALAQMIAHAGQIRGRSPVARERGHKEWLHFCIFGRGVEVIANFSLMDDLRSGALRGDALARVALLVRRTDGSGWDGDLDTAHPQDVRVVRGRIEADIGRNQLRFGEQGFELDIALDQRPLTLRVRLTPLTVPLVRPNTPLPHGDIHWMVVPRLVATGRLAIGAQSYDLDGAPAYHDHNWGVFRWGDDFAWQWGYALPDDPASELAMVFVRLTSRARTEDLGHGLFLWKGALQHKTFREGELSISPRGFLRPGRVAKFPRPMALLVPERSTEVPERLEIVGRSGADTVCCRFEPHDLAQILIPSERGLSTTVINEVVGRVRLEGRVRGQDLQLEGRGFFELLTGQ